VCARTPAFRVNIYYWVLLYYVYIFRLYIFIVVYNSIINGSARYNKPESNKKTYFKIRRLRRRRHHRILNMVVKKRDVENSTTQWSAHRDCNKAIVDTD